MPDPTPTPPVPTPVPPGTLRGVVHAWLATQPLWVRLAFSVLLLVAGAALKHYLGPAGAAAVAVVQVAEAPRDPPPATAEAPAPTGPVIRHAMGWVQDDDEVKAVASTLPHPVFAATPAGQADAIPDRVYLWDLAKAATGRHAPSLDQGQIGSCVGNATAHAVNYSQCVARVAALKAGQPPPAVRWVSPEVIYGGSRVQIGGGRIRGDGSVGAWAARWATEYGSVAQAKYPLVDLTTYSVSRCRDYGNRGCPAALVPEAKRHPTKTVSQVKTVDEAKRALASGYPVTVASNVGFANQMMRNAKGQLHESGIWPHCMCLIGYDKDSGFYCQNSWGVTWMLGPTGPGDPPGGGFYIEEKTVAKMLSYGDSWAFGDQVGFPARKDLDWVIRAGPRLGDPLAGIFDGRPDFALVP